MLQGLYNPYLLEDWNKIIILYERNQKTLSHHQLTQPLGKDRIFPFRQSQSTLTIHQIPNEAK